MVTHRPRGRDCAARGGGKGGTPLPPPFLSLSPSLSTRARVRNRRMWPSAHFARLCTFAVVTACTFMRAECCPVQRVHAGHDGMALRHASCRTTGGSGSGSEGRLHVHLFWVDCAPTSHIFFFLHRDLLPSLSLFLPEDGSPSCRSNFSFISKFHGFTNLKIK